MAGLDCFQWFWCRSLHRRFGHVVVKKGAADLVARNKHLFPKKWLINAAPWLTIVLVSQSRMNIYEVWLIKISFQKHFGDGAGF